MNADTSKYPDWFKQLMSDIKAMRAAQADFFKHKGKARQERAMLLEKKVDEWVKKCDEKGIINKNLTSQTNLFDSG